MNRIPIIFITLFCSTQVFCQGNATISGRVFNQSDKQPLPYVTVALNKISGETVTGTITTEDGRFVIKGIEKEEYDIVFSYIGFETKKQSILIGDLNTVFDLGKITLTLSSEQLGEVQIIGKRQAVSNQLDKKTYNIEQNISQSGGSMLKAMQNLPGITVDADGVVSLRGSDKVTVLIDGRQSSLTGFGSQTSLDNIPASNVEYIEIINNPSATYDARGMAGIINIIYKKNLKPGFNGETGLAIGVGELNQRKQNLPNISDKYSFTPKLAPNFTLNYRTEKVNYFIQADGLVRKKINCNEFILRDYHDEVKKDIQSQFLENRTQQLYNIKGGIDWYMNSKNTLTLFTLWEDEYHIDRGDVPYDYVGTGERNRLWGWAEDENTSFLNFSVLYNHKFAQPGHEIDVGYIYTGGGEDELFPFTDSSAVRNSTDETFLKAYEYVHSLTADYVRPLKSGRLELGTKTNLRHLPIEYYITPGQNSVLDPNLGEYSDYYENVFALYGNWVYESKKLEIEAGLRTEQSYIRYKIDPANIYYDDNDKYNYFNIFPNIRFTYKINDKNRFSLFYNRRIDRPGEFDLRPFPKYDDPEILKTGNPFLRPQYTQTYELAYKNSWKTGSAYIAGYYRLIDDIFSRVYTTDTTSTYDIVNTIPANLGKGTNLGVELVFEQELSDRWKINSNFNWYQNTIDGFTGIHVYPYPQEFEFAETENNTWNLKINTDFKLPNNFDFQLSGIYYAPYIIPQGKIEDRYSIDFGITKQMMEGKAELSLTASDILNTYEIETTIYGENFNLHKLNYVETQVVMLGFKYIF